MAQKKKNNKSCKASSLPKKLIEKHQIALDASGLKSKQQYFGWEKIQKYKVLLLIVLVIGYIVATTLKSTPSDNSQMVPTNATASITEINGSLEEVVAIKNDPVALNKKNKAEKPVRGFNEKHSSTKKKTDMIDLFNHYNAADSIEKKSNPTNSIEPVASNKKIIDETSNIISKLDSAKKPQSRRGENQKKKKKEEADSSADLNAKDKPNILRAVRKIIRSAICALRNRSGVKCG